MKKLILQNRLSPGDILIMSGAIRDLKLAYPNDYLVGIKSPCNEIFFYNPYVDLNLNDSDKEAEVIDMQYPIIHQSGGTGVHFSDGHRLFLQEKLNKRIPKTSMRPAIYFSQSELTWVNQLKVYFGYTGKYWIINSGIKNDFPLKFYPYYQKVVDLLKDKVQFVQVGQTAHKHNLLKNVLDMRGKTNLRQLFTLSYFAEGAISAVSLQMVIMQALRKPCVIVAGGREGMRWQAINDHVFLHTNGLLKCCLEDGCWKNTIKQCGDRNTDDVAKCMEMISPERIVDAVMSYYEGGRISL